MDARDPDTGGTAEGRPLTRRELRARAAVDAGEVSTPRTGGAPGVQDAEGASTAPEVDAPEVPDAPDARDTPDAQGASDESRPQEIPGEDAAPGWRPWDAAVSWSLRHELPAHLPPEQDVDDVRWEPVDLGRVDPTAPGAAPSGATSARGSTTAEVPRAGGQGLPEDPDVAAGPVGAAGPADAPGVAGGVPHRPDVPGGPDGSGAPERGAGEAPEAQRRPRDGSRADPPRTAEQPVPEPLPTLSDLIAAHPVPQAGPAETGWRAAVRRATGGVVTLAPGRQERADRDAVGRVQRTLDGPRTVVVINPKGGAHKTTATLLIAATFGRHRGGYTLAWDNNETRGTLGWRSRPSAHHATAVDLLEDLERFADAGSSRVGDLDVYVRPQGSAQFDVLASDEDAASAASVDDFAFRALHRTLTRFYRILVVDTGNNMRASNWQAAIEAADQVVVVSTVREDTAQSAAWALDALRATGHEEVVRHAVTVLSHPGPRTDAELAARLRDHFGRLTRSVHEVPFDPSLVAGGPIDHDALTPTTRRAWLHVTAAVADGL